MTEDNLVNMRLAHLNQIQSVIVRMAGFSASAKNLCVTILAALIAVAFQKPAEILFVAPVGVTLAFAIMDAYYLALERRFRELFETVAARPIADAHDLSLKHNPVDLASLFHALRSGSICILYGFLLLSTVPLLYVTGHSTEKEAQPSATTNIERQAAKK